ncbi:hypothetical protein V8J88_08285 [Massilia sp. W12]|uniref:hypothetical protein n=1 Tax=Massilia sp. W12 TaxID=3126507 RepID=UPI0030D5BFF9
MIPHTAPRLSLSAKCQYGALIFFLALAVYKVLLQIHGAHFAELTQAAQAVFERKPHWLAYQNRLLGPALIKLISCFGLDWGAAYKLFIFLMLQAQSFVLFALLQKQTGAAAALRWLGLYLLGFLLLQHYWFYPWDCIDALIFTLFAYGVLQAKPIGFFLALYAVEIINREAALFIALYIVLDAFTFDLSTLRLRLESRTRLLCGILLLIGGALYTKWIRSYLFISTINGGDDSAHRTLGNHVYFVDNLKNLLYQNFTSTDVLNSAFVLGSCAFLLARCKHYSQAQFKGMLIYLGIMLNILIFGLVNESRMYIALLPLLLFFMLSASTTDARPAKA